MVERFVIGFQVERKTTLETLRSAPLYRRFSLGSQYAVLGFALDCAATLCSTVERKRSWSVKSGRQTHNIQNIRNDSH